VMSPEYLLPMLPVFNCSENMQGRGTEMIVLLQLNGVIVINIIPENDFSFILLCKEYCPNESQKKDININMLPMLLYITPH
jgi:hypothetical protein